MNENSIIKKLLQKFVLGQCNKSEIDQVVSYFQKNNLTDNFPTVETVKEILDKMPEMNPVTADRILSNILQKVKETEPVVSYKISYRRYLAVAATIAVLISIGISYREGLFAFDKKQTILNGNEITLQMANGDVQVISEKGKTTITDSKGNVVGNHNGSKIVYKAENANEKLVYNILKIPYGKRFQLQLSDGTVVYLNSGTTLKYPVKFIGENRQVFLDGEAFFDVTEDKTHPFVVNAHELNVRVLGTHFNISSYPEDQATDVVLVEGSVGLYQSNEKFDADKNIILKPGFKASFDRKTDKIDLKPVKTGFYTAWINGGLCFRNMTFADISKKLERHYDVKIINKDGKFDNSRFNASFGDEPIEKVLAYFNEINKISYSKKDNEITIK